jgi:hypothetical protein
MRALATYGMAQTLQLQHQTYKIIGAGIIYI